MSNKTSDFPEDHHKVICPHNPHDYVILMYICASYCRGDFSPPLKILAGLKSGIFCYLNITLRGITHKKNMFVNVHLIESIMKSEQKRAFAHCRQLKL